MKKKNSFYSLKDNLKLFKLYRLYLLFSILQDKVSCGFKDNKYNMYNKYNPGAREKSSHEKNMLNLHKFNIYNNVLKFRI